MISSFPVPVHYKGDAYITFDVVLEGKHVFVASGVGRIQHGRVTLSDIANATFSALATHTHDAHTQVIVREIATAAAIAVKVAKTLEASDDEGVVFFVCRTSAIHDGVIEHLNVQWQTGGVA